jgi:hypothetical protein
MLDIRAKDIVRYFATEMSPAKIAHSTVTSVTQALAQKAMRGMMIKHTAPAIPNNFGNGVR